MAINIFPSVHLMGSPSRTQYLTGRYAMNLGFGEFNSWDDSVLGGIPIGQPTIANWLRDFGDYTTYGVGKWHLGTFPLSPYPFCIHFHLNDRMSQRSIAEIHRYESMTFLSVSCALCFC